MSKKEAFFGLVLFCASSLAALGAVEVVLRFFPVSEGVRSRPVTNEHPIATLEPGDQILWAQDWDFAIVNRVRVNRQGFVNDQDYEERNKPVLAVIGDSYIEALAVPYSETLHGRLNQAARLHSKGELGVYSFGLSGAPLSQYLVYSRHAQQSYNVTSMVFAIVGNDFDESLPEYAVQNRFHQFRRTGAHWELFLPGEYHRSTTRDLLWHSALVRYAFLHLDANRLWYRLRSLASGGGRQEYVGNTTADTRERRLTDSHAVVDAFLELLPEYSELEPANIAFVLDAPRRQLYGLASVDDLPDSYFARMRTYFAQEATARGYEVLDLAPRFLAAHKQTRAVFEWPTDGHWNALGHEVAFNAVSDGATFRRFLEASTLSGPSSCSLRAAPPTPAANSGR